MFCFAFIFLFISCSVGKSQREVKVFKTNSYEFNSSNKIPSQSGILENDLKIPGGVIPAGALVSVRNNYINYAISKKADFKIFDFDLDGDFSIIFHRNSNQVQCGILTKDITKDGFLFKKGTIIELDKNGTPNYRGLGLDGFKQQEWIDVEKIYNDKNTEIDIDQDGNAETLRTSFFNCYFHEILLKENMHLIGENWLPHTVIEFTDLHPDRLIHPKKIYAQKGQRFQGKVFENNTAITFCWDEDKKNISVFSISSSNYVDYDLDDAGTQKCQK